MRRTLMAMLCALALSMGGAACGSDSGGSGGSNGSSDASGSGGGTAQDDGSVDNSTPATEGQGTEEASGGGTKAVSVKLPGLPVGGNSSVESATLQCADVGWTSEPAVPDGIGIRITGISLTPSDGFQESSESCPGGAPACMSPDFRLTATSRCSVAVAWGESGFEQGGQLAVTSGEVICAPDQVKQCEAFRKELESHQDQIAQATIPLDPPDQSTTDGNGTDGGSTDTGSPDSGSPDSGSPDTGSPDSGSPDSGSPDTGSPDTGSGG